MYRYSLNSKVKFTCPDCGQANRFVKYIDNVSGQYLENTYGKCDRIDSCGFDNRPANSYVNDSECTVTAKCKDLYDSDDINEYIDSYRTIKPNMTANIFFMGLVTMFGIDKAYEAIDLYKLGTFYDGAVIYPYFFNDNLKSAKIFWYDEDLHRNKKKHVQWYHNVYYKTDQGFYVGDSEDDDFKLCVPLFGWDLLKGNDKTICCVESEKTAVIMSIICPEFIWVATGGLFNLQPWKFTFYNNRKWLFFPDLGNNKDVTIKDYWMKQVEKITENYSFTQCKFIDYLQPKININSLKHCIESGYDIVDFILDYMKYENVKGLPMDDLKTICINKLNEPIFQDCNYIEYLKDLLIKYV